MCRRISVYLALLTKTDFHSIISLVNICHSDVGHPDFCILSKTKNLCGYAEISDVFDFAVMKRFYFENYVFASGYIRA